MFSKPLHQLHQHKSKGRWDSCNWKCDGCRHSDANGEGVVNNAFATAWVQPRPKQLKGTEAPAQPSATQLMGGRLLQVFGPGTNLFNFAHGACAGPDAALTDIMEAHGVSSRVRPDAVVRQGRDRQLRRSGARQFLGPSACPARLGAPCDSERRPKS